MEVVASMTDTLTALRADYEALGKRIAELEKNPNPCPLEEGKEVRVVLHHGDIFGDGCSISPQAYVCVEDYPRFSHEAYPHVVIRMPFGTSAITVAQGIVKACGGSSD